MKFESGLSKKDFTYKVKTRIFSVVEDYPSADKKSFLRDDCFEDPLLYSKFVVALYNLSTDETGFFDEGALWDNIDSYVDIDYLYNHYQNNEYFAENFIPIFENYHLRIWRQRKLVIDKEGDDEN